MATATETLDRAFFALSDPTRRRILERLGTGEATVSELAEPFDLSLAAVSKHLRVLEGAGLLTRRVAGRHRHLRADPVAMQPAKDWIERQRALWSGSLDRLAEQLNPSHPIPNTRRKTPP